MPVHKDLDDVNLIPPARLQGMRVKARWRLWAGVCGVYGVLLAVALSSAYALWGEDKGAVDKQLQSASQRIEAGTASVIEERKRLAHATTAFQASRAVEDRPDWSRLLALVAEHLGPDVVLSGCRLRALDDQAGDLGARLESLQGGAAAALVFAPRQHQLHVTGFGKTRHAVSEFTVRLERTGLFSAVRCIHSERRPFLDGEGIAFTLECPL
ncbi:MAG: hypothetical protein KBE04_12050 [Phycisphaerae bacterium]|nr:hypothetical protein [Phycisphaerae bacterium]